MALVDELKLAYEKALEVARQAEEAWRKEVFRVHYIQPGDIIVSATGERAKVTHLSLKYGRIAVNAVLQNKDGQFGKRTAPLWNRQWIGNDYHNEKLTKAPETETADATG